MSLNHMGSHCSYVFFESEYPYRSGSVQAVDHVSVLKSSMEGGGEVRFVLVSRTF